MPQKLETRNTSLVCSCCHNSDVRIVGTMLYNKAGKFGFYFWCMLKPDSFGLYIDVMASRSSFFNFKATLIKLPVLYSCLDQ